MFAFLVAFDIVLMMTMLVHVFSPMANLGSIGVTFLMIYPGIAVIAPFMGAFGCVFGSPCLLRIQSSMNASCVLVNYPLTLFVQLCIKDELSYKCLIIFLWFNKIALSFFGAKVR